ncbi:MAG: hypothetical protein LUI60_03190 [Clostridia bacterium]|nr:hypothetical protein [Clostridia bacterium]
MACFLVPAAEAVITTIANKVIKTKEKKKQKEGADNAAESQNKVKFSAKLGWLNKMLWGGSALLAFEHLWHGEISPTFPFLTAVENGETAQMLVEMGTVGVTMAVLVTAVWGAMVGISYLLEKRSRKAQKDVQKDAAV